MGIYQQGVRYPNSVRRRRSPLCCGQSLYGSVEVTIGISPVLILDCAVGFV
jgi:hypothetical protein